MSIAIPILLLLLGLLLIVAEVFFPSLGILTLLAATSAGGSVVLAFVHLGTGVGFAFLGALLVMAPITLLFSFKILPYTPMGKRLILKGPTFDDTQGSAVEQGLEGLVGACGEALSTLRPAGVALIGGRRLDVVTRGIMIDAHDLVKVIQVEGNRVIVDRAGPKGDTPMDS